MPFTNSIFKDERNIYCYEFKQLMLENLPSKAGFNNFLARWQHLKQMSPPLPFTVFPYLLWFVTPSLRAFKVFDGTPIKIRKL